ncbi:Zinc finger and BTB domain containing protein 49 [Dissostichus eleginoides]|uniref:Zinc finger and BTB domain containing protein 49 n=1 Tax=Dissostichus eleginoides TaxID=100907 RepID=A0AAD9CAB0_DISEL|nr:Zinc finger and BTB domain containing protein 49 [Dissostichus eleginoides]
MSLLIVSRAASSLPPAPILDSMRWPPPVRVAQRASSLASRSQPPSRPIAVGVYGDSQGGDGATHLRRGSGTRGYPH